MTESGFDKIKKIVKIIGGKVVVVENGEPTFVIIDADEYINFENTKSDTQDKQKKIIEEKINKDVNIWKNRQDERRIKQIEIADSSFE